MLLGSSAIGPSPDSGLWVEDGLLLGWTCERSGDVKAGASAAKRSYGQIDKDAG